MSVADSVVVMVIRPDVSVRPLLLGAAVTVVGSTALTASTRPTAAIAGTLGYLIGAVLIRYGWAHGRRSARFGAANVITLARLVGTSWILALIVDQVQSGGRWTVVAIASVATLCLILDGIDGRLARSRGEASGFGARFDIEVDAATTLILSIAVPVSGIAGWWVIIMGVLRYGYLLAGVLQPALRRPLPFSQSRRVVGMAQAILLVISLFLAGASPALAESGLLAILPAIGLAALLWSFGRDAARQLRS